MLTTAEWITIATTAVSFAVLWGKMQAQLASLSAGLAETRASDLRQGERMGEMERSFGERLTALEAVDRERVRTQTGAAGVPMLSPPRRSMGAPVTPPPDRTKP